MKIQVKKKLKEANKSEMNSGEVVIDCKLSSAVEFWTQVLFRNQPSFALGC